MQCREELCDYILWWVYDSHLLKNNVFETQCCIWFWWIFAYDFACLQDWIFIFNCQIFVSGSKAAAISLQMELCQCKSAYIPIIWYPVLALLVSRLGFTLKLGMGDFFCFMPMSWLPDQLIYSTGHCLSSVSLLSKCVKGVTWHPLTSLSLL